MAKEFGLIIPTKNKKIVQAPGKRAAIFDEESDSDESGAATKPSLFNSVEKKYEKLAQLKVLDEDPTVFQYDEIYDDMEKQRKHLSLSEKNIDKKPKYVINLLKTAERRKRENELRIERIIQKEREIEGDEFKDKESYVTPSYQKKLEEMKALKEKEKREEYLESIGDVRKQGNLDGFYRYLYHQEVNNESNIKQKLSDVDPSYEEKDGGRRKAFSDNDKILHDTNTKKILKKRQYRKREESNSDKDTFEEIKKEHIPSNLDADSDFSIDSSDSDDDNVQSKAGSQHTQSEEATEKPEKDIKLDKYSNTGADTNSDIIEQINNVEQQQGSSYEIVESVLTKHMLNIWEKRTVGETFEEARKRYFERLALKQSV